MKVKVCPFCGKKPKIVECIRSKNWDRRRMVRCPNDCIRFIHFGGGDDNTLYKIWNDRVSSENKRFLLYFRSEERSKKWI